MKVYLGSVPLNGFQLTISYEVTLDNLRMWIQPFCHKAEDSLVALHAASFQSLSVVGIETMVSSAFLTCYGP